jgi:hypothetical protein
LKAQGLQKRVLPLRSRSVRLWRTIICQKIIFRFGGTWFSENFQVTGLEFRRQPQLLVLYYELEQRDQRVEREFVQRQHEQQQ